MQVEFQLTFAFETLLMLFWLEIEIHQACTCINRAYYKAFKGRGREKGLNFRRQENAH